MSRLSNCFMKTLVSPLNQLRARYFYHPLLYQHELNVWKQAGIITGYNARVNPAELGYHIKAFVNLEVNPDQKKEFYPYIKSCNNVVECNCVTGDYSMLIEVMFKSTEELDHFIGELQKFGSTKTQIVFSTSVEHRGIPLSND